MRHCRYKDPEDELARNMRLASEATTTLDIDEVTKLESEPRGVHVMKGQVSTDEPRGAHVNRLDPFRSVEHRALHAVRVESLDPLQVTPLTPDAGLVLSGNVDSGVSDDARGTEREPRPTKRRGTPTTRKRRWGLVPVIGAAGGLAVGIGGGAAFAYVASSSASNDTSTVSAVTVRTIGTTGSADLLPGRAGAAYFTLHNPNSFGLTFDQVARGATVVSDDTGLCGSDYVSIAQTLPFTIPAAVTVSPGGTSGIQSIPDLVKLAPNAPSTCQGVTFTVTLTLSGQSS